MILPDNSALQVFYGTLPGLLALAALALWTNKKRIAERRG
jgi:hypothetical protein